MGVHGLWELLAPVGRRVSVETLSGKKLAIDASIWMIQFMKAMRDERGDMVKNAHLLGFFRRICKLLFLRTKPVFVFDGGTPVLKRRTIIARRRQRENAQAKIRKTAEKMLLNHLKAINLKELASDIGDLKPKSDAKCEKVLPDVSHSGVVSTSSEVRTSSFEQHNTDELLAASLTAEEGTSKVEITSLSDAGSLSEEDDEEGDEEMMLPALHGKIDPSVLAALPPSMQLDLLVQMRERLMAENRQKYQTVKKAPTKFSELQVESYLKTVAFRREIDDVQKSASGRGAGGVRISRIASEANREFIFSSSFNGDKGVLAPGTHQHGVDSVQLPVEQSSAQNFSGVPSSSNGGATTSSRAIAPQAETSFGTNNVIASCLGPDVSKTENCDMGNVATYVDDRGRTRVSRVRALGIRMTRDLERNLHLIKGADQEKNNANKFATSAVISNRGTSVQRVFNPEIEDVMVYNADNDEMDNENNGMGRSISNDRSETIMPDTGITIELSLGSNDESSHLDADDMMFAHLVSGKPLKSPVNENQCEESNDSDFDWEDESVDVDGKTQFVSVTANASLPHGKRTISDAIDSEWKDGARVGCEDKFSSKAVSRGALEEDSDIREAIRRSLEDFRNAKSPPRLSEGNTRELTCEVVSFESPRLVLKSPSKLTLQQGSHLDEVIGDANPELESDGSNLYLSDFSTDVNNVMNLKSDVFIGSNHIELNELNSHISQSVGNLPAEVCGEQDPFMAKVGEKKPSVDTRSSLTTADANVLPEDLGKKFDLNTKTPCNTINESLLQELDDTVIQRERKRPVPADDQINVLLPSPEASIEEEIQNLTQERLNLADEQRKLERSVDIATSEMFAECQELLQMFGLPYIIAPMEAEAQCAYMEQMNLVDGVVTDDSDTFLFGARSIYKNIFDDRKYVETYFMKDIESELGLSREKLIRLALLLGSDYTEGISGIGIVNAMEVVNAFPEENGLTEFREWIESPDPSILEKVTVSAESIVWKKGSNNCNDANCLDTTTLTFSGMENESCRGNETADDHVQKGKRLFMDKHRKVSKNWHIPPSFPSETVIAAYACPQVDKSIEPFSWGKPDLFTLRKMCGEKFGWVNQKSDEILLPVINEYNKHETQLRLEAFYTFNERFAKIRSSRITKAVKGITGKQSAELMDDPSQHPGGRKRRSAGETKDDAEMPATTSKKPRKGSRNPTRRGKEPSQQDRMEPPGKGRRTDRVGDSNPRRSSRPRKAVNYEMDEGTDDRTENDVRAAGNEDDPGNCEVGSENDTGLLPSSSKSGTLAPGYISSGGGFCAEEDGKPLQENMVVNPLTPLPSLKRKRQKS